jgi:hypothetical protein
MTNQEFRQFYQQVKDPAWPECRTLQDFHRLSQQIKNECVNIHGMSPSLADAENYAATASVQLRNLDFDLNFCFDRMIEEYIPWPNLVRYSGQTTLDRDHGHEWAANSPHADYPRLLDYLNQTQIEFNLHDVDTAPNHSIYLVDIWFWDHAVDYIGSLSVQALDRLRKREIKLVFFYCEGDSAAVLQDTIYQQCDQHGVNPVDVMVIMGNTVTNQTPTNFLYFDDDYHVLKNSYQENTIQPWHDRARSRKMTFLNRVHKSWRCYFAAWYWHQQYHLDSYFSYRMIDCNEKMDPISNPLTSGEKFDPAFQAQVQAFLSQTPFSADTLSDSEHNHYAARVDQHYTDSYWHLVCETHLDLEHSQLGAFVTEKTWKPIANAQPFVILGTAGSLAYLKSLGYQTFNDVGIDESYDTIQDSTERFNAVKKLVSYIHSLDHDRLAELNRRCRSVVEYNQNKFFSSDRAQPLILLLQQIYKKISPRP